MMGGRVGREGGTQARSLDGRPGYRFVHADVRDAPALAEAMAETNAFLGDLRDPERREARMVHPQFYATVYEPGTADLTLLPDGPPPRRD